jgi:hypothetical protein
MADRYYQITEGEWVTVKKNRHRNQCCHCGLVHVIDYRTNKFGQPEIRVHVDKRATAAARRKFNFPPDD